MKTLDEVIEAEEICSQIDAECSKCPYKATAKGWCEEKDRDALYYLKEYKKDREDPDGDHQQLEKAQKLLWEFYQNDPLTWQELKGMEGMPVWVEQTMVLEEGTPEEYRQDVKEWMIISDFHNKQGWIDMVNVVDGEVQFDRRDPSWKAYRKERK